MKKLSAIGRLSSSTFNISSNSSVNENYSLSKVTSYKLSKEDVTKLANSILDKKNYCNTLESQINKYKKTLR